MTQEKNLTDATSITASDKARIVTSGGDSKNTTMEVVKDFIGGKSLQYNNLTSIDYSDSPYTILETDQVLIADTTGGEIVITLPLASSFSTGVWRNFIINHPKGDNNIKIQCSGSDEFVYGNTYFNLGHHPFSFTIGTLNDGTISSWGIVRNITTRVSLHREASWSSSNFSSMTAIPFDSEDYNNQDEIFVSDIGGSNPERLVCNTTGTFKINYTIDIDSTGGSTWNTTANIYKNGVALENTETRTGNYGGEDQSMTLPTTYIDLVSGDYLELRIDQNYLSGSLVHVMLNVEIRL